MISRRLAAASLLVFVTIIWGWTFVVVRDAVHVYPVAAFLALRFVVAAVVLAPILTRPGRGLTAGILPGTALTLAYTFQTAGLKFTTASMAGLLTGLFVVITPFLEYVVYRRPPALLTVMAVSLALAGAGLLSLGGSGPSRSGAALFGDGLEVLTALALSVHMLLLGRIPQTLDAPRVALGQIGLAAILFTSGSFVTGGFPALSGQVLLAVLVTGILATSLAFWVQTFVQQRISPTRTAVILVAEPAFAALFGLLLAGDRFNLIQGMGGAVLLAALIVHEAVPGLRLQLRT